MIGYPKKKRIVNRKLLDAVKKQPCVACGRVATEFMPVDPDHISTEGSGGDDVPENVWPLCREHHDMKGREGLGHMIKNFINCLIWLKKNNRFDVIERTERI